MIREMQRAVYANKVAKEFNITDIPLEFCYLSSEIAEAFEAYRKDLPTVGEELADIAIYLLGLAEILHVDLETAIHDKMAKNATRTYRKVNGRDVRVEEGNGASEAGGTKGRIDEA
jgi:NTP pyrophosphatase (non-canonical NTP hydrolase)